MATGDVFDIAIVGGGAAGCVVARRLAEPGDRSVILLEAGPDRRRRTPRAWRDGWTLPKPPTWGYESEPDWTGAINPLRRGKVLGGTSWLTRFAVRGPAADFDAWAGRGNPGWAYADVLPAFRALESDAEFGAGPWHGDSGPIPITRYPGLQPSPVHAAALEAMVAVGIPPVEDHNAPDAVGVGRMPMSSRGGVRVVSADAYLPPELALPTLTIRPNSSVASIEIERGVATGIRLLDGTVVHAGRIVLAAGTYGSPAILMRSGIGPAGHLRELDVPVEIDLPGVGSNLADHPAVEMDTGWRSSPATGPTLHSIATFRSVRRARGAAPDLMFWVADPGGDDPFTIESVLLKPVSRGSVRLRSADPSAPPRITLPAAVDEPEDVARLIEATRLAFEVARRPEFGPAATGKPPTEPRTPEVWREFLAARAYSIPHVVGTCAMGPVADPNAVVDELGSVHGIDRLSVIDASIIPDSPAGFPHLVILMLAERLAGRLAGAP